MTAGPLSLEHERLWHKLAAELRAWTGIILSPRDAHSVLAVLLAAARSHGRAPTDYLRSLAAAEGADERQKLIDRLVIRTTWFMREAAGIQALAEALVSELGVGSPVRIWSAGCSTGQEPYGLAMALLAAGLRPRILATDISREALRVAAEACYPTRAAAALPVRWQRKYTVARRAELVQVQDTIRSTVSFALHNLALTPWPPSGWGSFDAVVCRNVLLYFAREQAAEVIRNLSRSCRPQGYVLLSAAERPLAWMTELLEEFGRHDAVLLRLRGSSPVASAPPAPTAPPPAAAPAAGALLAEAVSLLHSGALPRCVQLLDGLLAREPLLATAHLIRGLALKQSGAGAQAAVALRCARFLFSDDGWLAPYHLALLLEQLGEPQDACEAYRHALSIIHSGGRSGLPVAGGDAEALLPTVAEACRARIDALGRLE